MLWLRFAAVSTIEPTSRWSGRQLRGFAEWQLVATSRFEVVTCEVSNAARRTTVFCCLMGSAG
jgi:hypothetical protein